MAVAPLFSFGGNTGPALSLLNVDAGTNDVILGKALRDAMGISRSDLLLKKEADAIKDPQGYAAAREAEEKMVSEEAAKFYKTALARLEDTGYSADDIKAFALNATKSYMNGLMTIVDAKFPLKFQEKALKKRKQAMRAKTNF